METWTDQINVCVTWKAICRKDGTHISKSKDKWSEHNFNEDLAEALIRLLDKTLSLLVNQVLPELKRDFAAKFEEATKSFPIALEDFCLSTTKHIANPLTHFLHTLERLDVEVKRIVEGRFDLAIAMCRVVDRKISPKIRLAMKPGYKEAAAQSGKFYHHPISKQPLI